MGYWNGSVLGWTKTDSGVKHEKLFFFEGVNLRQNIDIFKTHLTAFSEGWSFSWMAPTYLCPGIVLAEETLFCPRFFLLREVSIYRDLKTGDILQAWTSIYTGAATEVFEVTDQRK